MMERAIPEDWVHDTGRLVLVGSAAHPFPVRFALHPGGAITDQQSLAARHFVWS